MEIACCSTDWFGIVFGIQCFMTKTEISEVLSVYPLYLVQCTSLDWFPEGVRRERNIVLE